MIRSAPLTLEPVAAAVGIGPVPPGLRTQEPLSTILAVLVIGVTHGSVSAFHAEAVIAEKQSIIKAHLVACGWIWWRCVALNIAFYLFA